MKQKIFTIEADKITFFPNHLWKRSGYVLLIVFIVMGLLSFYTLNMLTPYSAIVMLAFIFLIVFPFFYAGSKSITIDGSTGLIKSRSLFGEKTLCPISDMAAPSFVTDLTFGNANNGGFYKLVPKASPYGKGIRLHTTLSGKSMDMATLRDTAIPFIYQLLTANTAGAAVAVPVITTDQLTLFYQQGHLYRSKRYKIVTLIIGILMLALGIYLLNATPRTSSGEKPWQWAFLILIGIVYIVMWSSRVTLDTASRTIEVAIIPGLYKKTFGFEQVIRFTTVRHMLYGLIHNGTDISMVLSEKGVTKQFVAFSRVHNARRIDTLIGEMQAIMQQGPQIII